MRATGRLAGRTHKCDGSEEFSLDLSFIHFHFLMSTCGGAAGRPRVFQYESLAPFPRNRIETRRSGLNPERWERIKQLFHSALEQEPGRRTAFLREACAGDEPLRAEVESMLARQAESPDFLESPALQAEAAMLARDLGDKDSVSARESSAGASVSDLPRPRSAWAPWWMYLLAAVFLADCLLRVYCHVLGPHGFDFGHRQEDNRSVVAAVSAGSAAERAGFQPGDILVALDGRPIRSSSDWQLIRPNLETGRSYLFEIERAGKRLQLSYPMERARVLESRGKQVNLLWQINALLLLATAFLIGFSRPYDSLARAGALALATLSVGLYLTNLPPGYATYWRSLPWGAGNLLWIPHICVFLVGPIVLTFFVRFPQPLFRSR